MKKITVSNNAIVLIFVASFLVFFLPCKGLSNLSQDSSHEVVTDVADGSGEDAESDAAPEHVCSPSSFSILDLSFCLLGLDYSVVSDLEMCAEGSEPMVEITQDLGSEFTATDSRAFICPGYVRRGSSESVDVMAMTKVDTFVSVSEAHTYTDTESLLNAASALVQAYDRDCDFRSDLGLENSYECDLNGQVVYVSFTSSAEGGSYFLVVNYITDVEHFIAIVESV